MSKFLKLSIFFGLFIFVLVLATSTYARESESENSSTSTSTLTPTKVKENQREKLLKSNLAKETELEDEVEEDTKVSVSPGKNKEKREAKISQIAERKENKLSESRLKICEVREKNIENRFKTLLTLGTNTHKDKEMIVERVDTFYTTKLVPAGYSLPNYAALKADIASKEAAVQSILDEAKTNGSSFSCDSNDPKAQADDFKTNIQSLIAANKAYKASVKTFVVAVRDLAKQAKSDKMVPSPSVSPAVSPEVTETL